ncbi:hypothetical protein GCM10009605_47260 [Nocardiopsis composta]
MRLLYEEPGPGGRADAGKPPGSGHRYPAAASSAAVRAGAEGNRRTDRAIAPSVTRQMSAAASARWPPRSPGRPARR